MKTRETRPMRVFVTFVVLVTIVSGFALLAQPQQDPPKFRAEANLVRVDVYPIAEDGQAVADLTEADFEIREDNVAQSIATFERVAIERASPGQVRPEPSSVGSSRALAAGERARILVVFLDTYHTDSAAARAIHQPLVRLLDQVMGPDDVIAVMTPEMSARDLTFSRRASTIAPALERFEQFAMRDSLSRRDPEEDRYETCFPERGGHQQCLDPATRQMVSVPNPYAGVARELIARRREHRVVTALADLTRTLNGLNDARKAVLVLSSGWLLYRESPALMRLSRCDTAPVARRPATSPDGQVTTEPRSPDGVDQTICEADRRRLGQLDIQAEFRRMLDGANRANVSFYPIDARGLAVFDNLGATQTEEPSVDTRRAGSRVDSLRTLAETTDGLAVVNTNDLTGGIGRLVSDLTSYYLIGYYPTNARADGGYRRISVSVNRRGVTVRARRGYRALSAGEVERQRTAAALAGQTLDGPLGAVPAALAGLQQLKASLPVRSRIAYGPAGNGRLRLWAVTEISAATARTGAWLGGGAVDVSLRLPDNSAVASAEASLPAGYRAVVMDLGELDVPELATVLSVRLRPAGEGPSISDDVALAPMDASRALGVPILSRRGPTTATRFVPTADPQFTRTERVRLELPRATAPSSFTAALHDRAGSPLNVRVTVSTRQEGAVTWAVAELALAPLAHGDYVVKLIVDGQESVTAIRVVP
jgi:VWFA-related protein